MDKTIKFGIVGTNFISDWFAKAVRENTGVEVKAVYSRTQESGKAFADKNNIENIYTDYEKMLDSDIDSVYIASPTFMHYTHAKRAMERGKNVFCEKMITVTKEQFQHLRELQARTRVTLIEAMRPDFDPVYNTIRAEVRKLGKVRHVNLTYCQYSRRYDKFKEGTVLNAFNPKIGNSALQDIGIYPLHTCINLFGKPESIQSKSIFLHNGFEGEGNIILTYPDMIAEVAYSKITDGVNPSFIECEDGTVTFERVSTPKNITVYKRGEEPRKLDTPYTENNMKYEVRAFRDAVNGKINAEKYLDITDDTMTVVDEIYKQNSIDKIFDKEVKLL